MKDLEAKALPTELYLPFVESLFKNRGTLWTGMVVHILSCAIIYATTGSRFYILSIGLFLAIFSYRIYWFRRFDMLDRAGLSKKEIESWEMRYVHGAAATAFLLGINSAYAVLVLRDMLAAFMCIAVTMASMVSIVGRNYGSARAVGLQTIGCCLPLVIACLMTGELYLALISLFLIPFGLTTQSMARGVREFLYENVLASREMARIADQFDIALSTMTHALIMLDEDGRVQVINRRACELLELPDADELKGAAFITVLRRSGKSLSDDILRKIGQLSGGHAGKTLLCLKETVYLEFSLSHRTDGGVVMLFEDVSARVAAEEKILHLVRYDTLTGLPTRGYFAELATRHLKETGGELLAALVIFDVDGFKHVNDMQGHVIGDKLLASIAERLRGAATENVIVARLVGDEFVILATGSDRHELEQRISSIQMAVQGVYSVDRTDLPVLLNCGGVILDSREFDMEAWQIKADLALNDAKSVGNGMLTIFRPEMDARYVAEQRLKADLRNAIEQGELNVVYQPMYRPDGSEMECCEALVRWSHAERGFIGPAIFIPMAESMGMISQITHFVLDRACRDCASWQNGMAVSVNLSIHDLKGGQIVAKVAETLERYDLTPDRLHLEVTESCFMDEPVVVSATLGQLRESGVTIAIDDFGTGFSSLSYLDSLPIDIVKIDRAFVREIGTEPRRLKLLSGIVHLSRELDLKIVIEGVETFEQLELVKKHRFADLVQGYIFSPPIPANAIVELSNKTTSGRRMAARQSRREKNAEPRAFGTVG
ncbi:GGDEF domain-containing phosphodiesterase [Neorhizobium sp. NCHU2750]|uniref:putative bifunctional diguanylate cyclase/phosphodiesterase n=1 Tax=Neorhizobium sp. NCHU2750 TaxID=1825976 RepID=UPI000E70F9B2|nr:membrane protein [Neorhizobium sp. NCHU2750]